MTAPQSPAQLEALARAARERQLGGNWGPNYEFEAAFTPEVVLSLLSDLREARREAAYFAQLNDAYFAASFEDEQAPDKTVLKFEFPVGLQVSASLTETLDRAATLSPSPAPQ